MFTLKSSHSSSGSAKRRGSGTSLAPKRRIQLPQLQTPALSHRLQGSPRLRPLNPSCRPSFKNLSGPGTFRGKEVEKIGRLWWIPQPPWPKVWNYSSTPAPNSHSSPPCAQSSEAQVSTLREDIILFSPKLQKYKGNLFVSPFPFPDLFCKEKGQFLPPSLDLSRLNKGCSSLQDGITPILDLGIVEPLWDSVLDLEDAFFHLPIGWLLHFVS